MFMPFAASKGTRYVFATVVSTVKEVLMVRIQFAAVAVGALLSLSACGAKQEVARSSYAPALTVGSGPLETVRTNEVIEPKSITGRIMNTTVTEEPVFVFEVKEEKELYLTASSNDADLVMLVTGATTVLFNDDGSDLDPEIRSVFQPGVYEVRIGHWGQIDGHAIEYNLVIQDVATMSEDELLWTDPEVPFYGEDTRGELVPTMTANIEGTPVLGVLTAADFTEEGTSTDATVLFESTVGGLWAMYHLSRPLAVIDASGLGEDQGMVIIRPSNPHRRNIDTVMLLVKEDGTSVELDDFEDLSAGTFIDASMGKFYIFAGNYGPEIEGDPLELSLFLQRVAAPVVEPVETAVSTYRGQPIFHGIKGWMKDSVEGWSHEGCAGVVRDENTPDWRVRVASSGQTFSVTARSRSDAILAMRSPSGEIFCNDDADGTDSRITIANAEEGTYEVWGGVWQGYGHQSMGARIDSTVVLSVEPTLEMGVRPVRAVGMDDFAIHSVQHSNRQVMSVLGDRRICGGRMLGYIDTSRPSIVLENTTSETVVGVVRSNAEHDTVLYARNIVGHEDCADDDLGIDAYVGSELKPGQKLYVWAGAVREDDAKKPMELRYLFFNEDTYERFEEITGH